jgi:hypothetical protein
MEEKDVKINTRGLGHLKKSNIVNDLTFTVGNHHCDWAWFVAQFTPPQVHQFYSVKIVMNEFNVEPQDPGTLFDFMLSVSHELSIFVSQKNVIFHFNFTKTFQLGNSVLIYMMFLMII